MEALLSLRVWRTLFRKGRQGVGWYSGSGGVGLVKWMYLVNRIILRGQGQYVMSSTPLVIVVHSRARLVTKVFCRRSSIRLFVAAQPQSISTSSLSPSQYSVLFLCSFLALWIASLCSRNAHAPTAAAPTAAMQQRIAATRPALAFLHCPRGKSFA